MINLQGVQVIRGIKIEKNFEDEIIIEWEFDREGFLLLFIKQVKEE